MKLPEVWEDPLRGFLHDFKARDRDKNVRWIGLDRLHVTLVFLGQVPVERIPGLAAQLRLACLKTQSFSLGLRGFGAFPETGAPRVLWLGLSGDLETLTALSSDLVASSLPYVPDLDRKPFRPHLTVGRVRSRLRRRVFEQLSHRGKSVSIPPVSFTEVKLLSSELRSTGSVYTELDRFSLRAVE